MSISITQYRIVIGYFNHFKVTVVGCSIIVRGKFIRSTYQNVVPIVYGGVNYSAVFPPKSYINIEDFDTPLQLSKFLKYLADNPKEYGKYFQWKETYFIAPSYHINGHKGPTGCTHIFPCCMCEYLRDTWNQPSSVDLTHVFKAGEICRNPFWMNKTEMTSNNLIPVEQFQEVFEGESMYRDCRRCKQGHKYNLISHFSGLKQYV